MLSGGRVRVVALGVADAFCVCVCWAFVVCGYKLFGHCLRLAGVANPIGGYDPQTYLSFWPVPLVFCALNALLETYHGNALYPSAPLSPVEEMRRLFGSSLLTHTGIIACLGFAYQTLDGYSRVVVAVSGLLVAVGAQSFRNWTRRILAGRGWGQISVVLAGSGETARHVAQTLEDDAYSGFRLVGCFAEDGKGLSDLGVPSLGTLHDIVPEARRRDVKILLACQDARLFRAQMKEFSSWFTYVDFIPTVRAFPVFGARAVCFDGIGGLEMVNQRRMRAQRVQKWLLDRALSVVALAFALPLSVLIAAAIKLTSRGPVFYSQERLGLGGKPFRVWKFRSMAADADARLRELAAADPSLEAEWRTNFKLARDPRVTAIGRFLRRTSLDELPQLINVFRGEMALVGPRPIVTAEVPRYGEAYDTFASVRPGITGRWQVSGRSDTDYARRVALDTYYVLNWSPWMDVWILLRTVYAVLFMRGAR